MRRLILAVVFVVVLVSRAACARDHDGGDRWARKAERPGNTAFHRTAYEQLAMVHLCKFEIWNIPGSIEVVSWNENSQIPTDVLYRMGLKVLPIVAEALDDDTPTLTVTHDRWGGNEKLWKVNEIVAMLIIRIADREFAIGQYPKEVRLQAVGDHPEMARSFQRLIRDWYSRNYKMTLAQRKTADVGSDVLQNRLKAIEWIGANRAVDGKQALIKRIDDILNSKESDSSLDAELSSSAYSLGRIGGFDAIPSVSRVCRRFSAMDQVYYSSQIKFIFQAYHGYALLGEKKAALEGLEMLYDRLVGNMEESSRVEYQKALKAASEW